MAEERSALQKFIVGIASEVTEVIPVAMVEPSQEVGPETIQSVDNVSVVVVL